MGYAHDTEYLNLLMGDGMASAKKSFNRQVVMVDQLLTEDLILFFILVFMAADERKTAQAAAILQKKTRGVNKEELIHGMDEDILNLLMDAYWCAWTFIIGHELFHLNTGGTMGFQEEEHEADTHGYEALMKMIVAQKKGEIPFHLRVYSEDLYLAPVMCMKYFEWKEYAFPDWFSPDQRMEHIFDMFDDVVPDDFDAEQGNQLLNLFLDALEKAMG